MRNEQESQVEPVLYDLATVQVLGLSELAKRWGVSKQRVDEITSARCPHWRKLDCGRIWLMHEVEAFEETWTRKTGVHIEDRRKAE